LPKRFVTARQQFSVHDSVLKCSRNRCTGSYQTKRYYLPVKFIPDL
jgi:hypothetical protein